MLIRLSMSMKRIPYGKQHITEEDIEAVVETLKSDFLTQGPKIEEFERAFAQYIGVKYAVAVSNGTAALHLSTLAVNVKPGQKVITTPITFAASANCVKYCGGDIVFCDIDPKTYLLDIQKVRELLESSPRGTFAGIIPVDLAGLAVNLEAFRKLANEYKLWIIEDACHAPGGFFKDNSGVIQRCGNGNFADLAVFSFHPVKHIAAGEGGMITTNDRVLYEKLLMLRTHGITRDTKLFRIMSPFAASSASAIDYPGWYMEMQALGFNYRLTDFQAALGLSQLKKADLGLIRRRQIALRYSEAFETQAKVLGHSGFVPGHAYHLYIIQVEDRLGLYNHLRQHNIFAQVHYIPVHLMPYYRELGYREGDYAFSEDYYRTCISLPMFPSLTDEEQEYVIEKILNFLNG
jgi:UDP-4-amino-4,6-dideoxy-N-acetyl-beta-L-altrosamine transaminase